MERHVAPDGGAQDGCGIVDRVRSWLFDDALPFWTEVGVDRQGPGFVEHLTLEGRPAEVEYKRVRVQARQIYCFTQAEELGWSAGSDVAKRGLDLLTSRAWLGPERGWASVLTRSGEVLDETPDLYDMAFVLFALGWWYRVTGDGEVLALAHRTLDFLWTRFRHPSGRGYLHRKGGSAPYLQNPHMHLTEAMIVLRDASGDERFAAEASALVSLCIEHFFDSRLGTLAEHFSSDWLRCDPPGLEPGHHYEWVWILMRYMNGDRDTGPLRGVMRSLFEFASRCGRDPNTGLVYDRVDAHGAPIDRDFRCWPQAEMIKGALAIYELDGRDPVPVVAQGIKNLFLHYLTTRPRGTWIDHRDSSLRPKVDKIPASTFYHLVLCCSEVLRFGDLFRTDYRRSC